MNWETKVAELKRKELSDSVVHIVIYTDNEYINELEIELNKFKENRISRKDN